MKALNILIVMLVLIMSVGAVCAAENITDNAIGDDSKELLTTVQEDITTDDSSDILKTTQNDIYTTGEGSFTNLTDEINDKTSFNLERNYKFNNETDDSKGIVISKDNFVLNGDGHTIDANNQSRIFNITANNVTLSNLILTGGNADKGGAIYATGSLTLNNVTFADNYASKQGGAVGLYGDVTLNCNNSQFTDNYADAGSSIFVEKGKLNIYNTDLSSKVFNRYSQIVAFKNSIIYVENVTFINSSSSYATALFFKSVKSAKIKDSKFINLKANLTAGAIGLRNGGELYIENCEFTNTTSTNNGGAVFVDIIGEFDETGNVTLTDNIFRDTYSGFGGAYVQLGGKLLLNNSEFINNHATFNGGAVYLSYTDAEIDNCNFTSNGVELNDQDYPTYGGAVLFDMATVIINNVNFINNTASAGSAIYAYDTSYNIKNSLFENNTNPIYTFFDGQSNIDESNTFINDNNTSTNNTYYATIIGTQGLQLTLLNNSINVTALPKRFDLRDWGWVSPVKNQGWIGACWTFGMTSALESSLLKATGILSDLSENSMRNTMLRYSVWGSKDLYEGAYNAAGVSYLISWLGAFIEDADSFDELGKISPYISTLQDVHVQDAIFIPNNEIPNGTQMKEAIMKYGALDVGYFGQATFDQANPYFNPKTNAQYVNVSTPSNHEVSVVGWDDNYPKENFLITPPGDGAWIIKNSWGASWGDNGYLYVSYYDKSFVASTAFTEYATAIIFENTVPYNKNYQYDIAWAGSFSDEGNMSYLNQYLAQDDDLIAAVGTYFNRANVNYKVEIYVNDELKLTQEGISPFYGYHTIKLDSYIPIKKGDVFKAKITSNAVPFIRIGDERVHYTENISFLSDGVNWEDAYKEGIIACLKVYTVADDSKVINNENITVDYASGSYFTVQVVTADGHSVGAGAAVNITINGKTTPAFTDADGIAKVKITDVPGTYDVTTTYNGQTYKNRVAVKLNPSTCKITQNKNINVDYDGGKYFSVKIVSQDGKVAASGVSVKFTINGKTTTVKTDKKRNRKNQNN
ncbi:C1 family peptidase [Methanobrevibacter sp.]